ncbi:MAG: RNA-binding cell elongation regulator Jag/EloR [bacterium]
MEPLRMKGRKVEEAIKAALEVLNKKREEVDVIVIEEGNQGMLGMIGGKEAEVEVHLKSSLGELARATLQQILDKMNFLTLINITSEEEESASLEIKGDDIGCLIGREGQTLDSMQYLLTIMISKKLGKRVRIILDAASYREKRNRRLADMAKDAADQVTKSGKEYIFGDLNPAERRVIHMELSKDKRVFTVSDGLSKNRRLKVVPASKKNEYSDQLSIKRDRF